MVWVAIYVFKLNVGTNNFCRHLLGHKIDVVCVLEVLVEFDHIWMVLYTVNIFVRVCSLSG